MNASFPSEIQWPAQTKVFVDPMSKREERWVPMDTHSDLQKWRRLIVAGDTDVQEHGALLSVGIRLQDCMADFRGGLKKLFSKGSAEKTYGEMFAPLGKNEELLAVQKLTQKIQDALLVWTKETGNPLNASLIQETFPASESVETVDRIAFVRGVGLPKKEHAPRQATMPRTAAEMDAMLAAQNTKPLNDIEIAMEERLSASANNFLHFGSSLLLPRVNALPDETRWQQALKKTLKIPFEIVKQNEQNPLRNGEVVKRIAKNTGLPYEAITFPRAHPYHFSYLDIPGRTENLAGFAPMYRSMLLPPANTGTSAFHHVVKLHELIHVYQHAGHRQRMGMDYLKFFSGQEEKPVTLLEDEVQAYGYGIESLNLLLDDAIRQAAQQGQILDPDTVLNRLAIPPMLRMPVHFTLHLGKEYFTGNEGNGVYPMNYCNAVLMSQIHDGYTPYQLVNGRPEKINI